MKKDTSRSISEKNERINPKHAKFIIRAPLGLRLFLLICTLVCISLLCLFVFLIIDNIRVLGEVLFLVIIFVLCLVYFLAVITQSIEVCDGVLKIRYLFFIKKEYPIKRITGWYTNTVFTRTGERNFIGVYIDGKKLILPMQPESRWKDIDSWEHFLKSVRRKHEHISEVEFWPFNF